MHNSNHSKSFFEENKEVIILMLFLGYFFYETRPQNDKRVHWVGFYSLNIMVVLTGNLLLSLVPDDRIFLLPFNLVHGFLFFVWIFRLIEIDLIYVRIDRQKARRKAQERNCSYSDPYSAAWIRRIFMGLLLWVPCWLYFDKQLPTNYTILIIFSMVVLYAIRDFIYRDTT